MNESDAKILKHAHFQTDYGLERVLDMSRERLLEVCADLMRDRDAWRERAKQAGFDMESLHP